MIQAIKDKVVTKMMTREKTKSGIIIPQAHQEPQAFCKVLSVGDEVTRIKEGDVIVCHIRGGMDVVLDKEIIKVLKEEEIYGTLTDEDILSTLVDIELKGKTEGTPIIQPATKIIS